MYPTAKIDPNCISTNNCDATWPTYHNKGACGCKDLSWHKHDPKLNVNDNSMCPKSGCSPMGVASEFTESYNPDLLVGAISDNILGMDSGAQKYLSPNVSNSIISPSCDCSNDLMKFA